MNLLSFKIIYIGVNVFGIMKYENGIHQTRKKQGTEKSELGAKMSSCTCSISVHPRPDPKDILLNESDLKIEERKSIESKTGSCIVTHLPTGMSTKMPFGSFDNRIVEISKEAAIQSLKDKLYQLEYEKEETIYWNRDEKIRSYNPDKQIVTDHRLMDTAGEKVSSIEQFLKGHCGYDVITNFSSELEEFYALESLMNFRDESDGKKCDDSMPKKKSSKPKKVKHINKYASKKKAYKEKD